MRDLDPDPRFPRSPLVCILRKYTLYVHTVPVPVRTVIPLIINHNNRLFPLLLLFFRSTSSSSSSSSQFFVPLVFRVFFFFRSPFLDFPLSLSLSPSIDPPSSNLHSQKHRFNPLAVESNPTLSQLNPHSLPSSAFETTAGKRSTNHQRKKRRATLANHQHQFKAEPCGRH